MQRTAFDFPLYYDVVIGWSTTLRMRECEGHLLGRLELKGWQYAKERDIASLREHTLDIVLTPSF